MQNLPIAFLQKIILCVLCIFSPVSVLADEIQNTNFCINYNDTQYIEDTQTVDVSLLQREVEVSFPQSEITLEWDILGQTSQTGSQALLKFQNPGEKTFTLNVYKQGPEEEERTLFTNISGNIFSYTHSLGIFYENEVPENKINTFIEDAKNLGILIEPLNISDPIEEVSENTNFFITWGSKEYIFSTISELTGKTVESQNKKNIAIISSHNPNILKNYITNSISGNELLGDAFIIDESLRRQILNSPENIGDLRQSLVANDYSFTSLDTTETIAPWFFISKFINTLSLNGVETKEIYIFLMIPVLLTFVAISKHVIGFSTLGTSIPIFLSILCIKFGLIFMLSLSLIIFFLNIALGYIFKRYTLLFMPKIICITLINIIAFLLFFNLSFYTVIPTPQIHDVVYIIVFYLAIEKMMNIIVSKEFREYKRNFIGTYMIALLGYILYNVGFIQSFLLAYPEYLLLLIPFNFYLGRFTGLRITEYFRFRDVTRSIEE